MNYNGTGIVDNDTKTITIKTFASVDKIGIMHYQGTDEKTVGAMTLKGYTPLDMTSKEILETGKDEPKIYVDKNKCIFIDINADTSDLTLVYQQFADGTTEYEPVEYKVKIEIVDLSSFKDMGIKSSEKHYEVADSTNDEATTQPTTSSTADEISKETVKNDNGVIQTGSPINSVILLNILLAGFVFLFVYKRKTE